MNPKPFLRTIAVIITLTLVLLPLSSSAAQVAAAPDGPDALGITFGAHIVPTNWYNSEISQFNTLAGKDIGVVMYFSDWASVDDFLIGRIEMLGATLPAVMITWEPRTNCGYSGAIDPHAIINGSCDAFIRSYVDGMVAKHSRVRFLIRFAHEMNISDTAWWPGRWNGDANLYISMYRKVHDVFMAEMRVKGATNAEWVWSPNYASNPPDAWNALPNYYPGDAYVDWIGLSGYNWYTYTGNQWLTFRDLYQATLEDLTCRYAKPQIIAEIGSVTGPYESSAGPLSKAHWLQYAFQYDAVDFPFVRAVVWFNDYAFGNSGAADFRLTTSTARSGSVQALASPAGGTYLDRLKTAFTATGIYNSTLPSLSAATPAYAICGSYSVNPGAIMMTPGSTAEASFTGRVQTDGQTLSVSSPSGSISTQANPAVLSAPYAASTLTINVKGDAQLGTFILPVNIDGNAVSQVQVMVVANIHRRYLPVMIK